VRLAGGDLGLERIPVLRRPALEDVRQVDVVAPEADAREQRRQQLARLSGERLSALVLVEAGRLAHDHQLRVGVAGAEHDAAARLGERTARTAGGLGGEGGECRDTCGGIHRAASLGGEADGSYGVKRRTRERGRSLCPAVGSGWACAALVSDSRSRRRNIRHRHHHRRR
jgi:hypothetical protein